LARDKGDVLRNSKLTAEQKRWQKKFGDRLKELIHGRGYQSIYDFWINSGISDHVSRSYLNYLTNGERDPRLYLIRILAKTLGTKVSVLIDFD